jgi:hypothetical protein
MRPITVPRGVDDPDTTNAWTASHAAALNKLNQDIARSAALGVLLDLPLARVALSAVDATQRALADAQRALSAAQEAKTAAEATAARYENNEVAQAQANLDTATANVGLELARLASAATTSTALTATVDGLALHQRYHGGLATDPPTWNMATLPFRQQHTDTSPDPQITLPALDEADHANYTAVRAVLDLLDQRVEAVTDLIAAESMHHLVNANPTRSGAALDIASTGAVPDTLDVIRTPVIGHDLTHRLLILTDPDAAPVWTATRPGAAAVGDPLTTAWVSTVLPNPADVHLLVQRIDPDTNQSGAALELTADGVDLDPLGWVRVSADPAELHARIARIARNRWANSLGPAAATGRLVITDAYPTIDEPTDPAPLALTDLLAAAHAARQLLANARAIAPADLILPTEDASSIDSAVAEDIVAQVDAAYDAVTATLTDLTAVAGDGASTEAMIDALLAASALGVSEATPALDVSVPTPAQLQAQVNAAITRLTPRTASPRPTVIEDDPDATVAAVRDQLASLCGIRMPLLAPLDAPSADLGSDSATITGADPASMRSWLYDHAQVRPAVAALRDCYDIAEACNCPAELTLRATQLPLTDAAIWAGSDPAPNPGVVNVVTVRAYPADTLKRITGLAIDSWTQTVPAPTHSTGLAFHYNEPNATPPQAILVCVAPDSRPDHPPNTWDLDTLLDCITSTIALAADRAVAAELTPGAAITVPDTP